MQHKSIGSVVSKAAGLGPRQVRVVASTETPDRAGDVLLASGVYLKNYERNPIVLSNHDPDDPIGTAKVEIKSGRLEALITFAPEGASDEADEVCALAKAGVISAASVGFMPLAQEPLKGGGYRITSWELYEISLVSVPCNAEATMLQRSLGGSRHTMTLNDADHDRRSRELELLRLQAKSYVPPSRAEEEAYRRYQLSRLKSKGAQNERDIRNDAMSRPVKAAHFMAEEIQNVALARSARYFDAYTQPVRR